MKVKFFIVNREERFVEGSRIYGKMNSGSTFPVKYQRSWGRCGFDGDEILPGSEPRSPPPRKKGGKRTSVEPEMALAA